MRAFKIKLVSQANTIISLLIFFATVFLFGLIRTYLLPEKLWSSFPLIFTIIVLLWLFFLFQKLARAWTEWTINEVGIKIDWLTQFAFNHKADLFISWNEIDSYRMPSSSMYTGLKIYLKSGNILRFYHYNGKTDNFQEMIAAFKSMYRQRLSK